MLSYKEKTRLYENMLAEIDSILLNRGELVLQWIPEKNKYRFDYWFRPKQKDTQFIEAAGHELYLIRETYYELGNIFFHFTMENGRQCHI